MMKTISSKQISKSILLLLAVYPHEFVLFHGGLSFRVYHGWRVKIRPADDSFRTFDVSMSFGIPISQKGITKNYKAVPIEFVAWRIFRTVKHRDPSFLSRVGAWL